MTTAARSLEELRQAVSSELGALAQEAAVEHGDLILTVKAADLFETLKKCKESQFLSFNLLVDITAVDWLDARPTRFEVVYQLLSLKNLWRVTIKSPISEDKPEVPSVTPLWNAASFLEREVWDMFGIRFAGHPDLRRILLYEEFVGHPLRKDYPVQGKQPRIPLRSPEVENTARHMSRPDLVTIRSRKSGSAGQEAR